VVEEIQKDVPKNTRFIVKWLVDDNVKPVFPMFQNYASPLLKGYVNREVQQGRDIDNGSLTTNV
jgi:hypothetical protein